MFYNDWTMQGLAAEHQRELRCQADAERFAQTAVPQPDRWRWLRWLGQQLIITGERLQAQHKAAMTLEAMQAATERGCQTR